MSDYTKEQIAAKREAIAVQVLVAMIGNAKFAPHPSVADQYAEVAVATADQLLIQLGFKK